MPVLSGGRSRPSREDVKLFLGTLIVLIGALIARIKRACEFPEGDPVEVQSADSRAESQSALNGPSGSPTSPSGRASWEHIGFDHADGFNCRACGRCDSDE